MNPVAGRLAASGLDRGQVVGQHRGENLDSLEVARPHTHIHGYSIECLAQYAMHAAKL